MKLAQVSPNRRKCNFKLRKSFEKLIHVAVELFGGTVWKFAESTQQVGGGEIVIMKSLNVVTLCLYKISARYTYVFSLVVREVSMLYQVMSKHFYSKELQLA